MTFGPLVNWQLLVVEAGKQTFQGPALDHMPWMTGVWMVEDALRKVEWRNVVAKLTADGQFDRQSLTAFPAAPQNQPPCGSRPSERQ